MGTNKSKEAFVTVRHWVEIDINPYSGVRTPVHCYEQKLVKVSQKGGKNGTQNSKKNQL